MLKKSRHTGIASMQTSGAQGGPDDVGNDASSDEVVATLRWRGHCSDVLSVMAGLSRLCQLYCFSYGKTRKNLISLLFAFDVSHSVLELEK